MKALSVCQPWAHLIVAGDKAVENRSWPTNFRGDLLIHAGKATSWWTDTLKDSLRATPDDPRFAYGAIVGCCMVVGCITVDEARRRGLQYAEGPWCWLLYQRLSFVRPIPWRGALGLFEVPDRVVAGVDSVPTSDEPLLIRWADRGAR